MEFSLITDLTRTAQCSVCTLYVPSVMKSPHIYILYCVDMCSMCMPCTVLRQMLTVLPLTAFYSMRCAHRFTWQAEGTWTSGTLRTWHLLEKILFTSSLTHEQEVFKLL